MKSAQKKPIKTKEKITFKLDFHATKVPRRGWDQLLVSLVSVETGKVCAKTGKAPVKNGSCIWPDSVFKSIATSWDINGKRSHKELYRLVVSMGLSRFGILGEASIDMTEYLQAHTPVSLSLPLQNCNFGSLLHVKLQHVMQKDITRVVEDEAMISSMEAPQHDGFEINVMEEKNDCVPHRYSIDSIDVPPTPGRGESQFHITREGNEVLMSPSSSMSSYHESNGFQYCTGMTGIDLYTQSSQSSDSIRDELSAINEWSDYKSKGLEVTDLATLGALKSQVASKDEEAGQMEVEIGSLKRQLGEEIVKNEGLQKMIAKLLEGQESSKQEKEKSVHAREADPMSIEQSGSWEELQEELGYQKSLNSNLSLQLRKTQDSNSELLLEIQDLEKMLHEKNKSELQIPELRGLESANEDLKNTVNALQKELQELECDSKELTEENMNLLSQLKQANDTAKAQDIAISQLENEVTELKEKMKISTKRNENDEAHGTVEEMRKKLEECEESYEAKLASSRRFIDDLNSSVMMLRSKNTRLEREIQNLNEHNSEVLKEVETLRMENDGQKEEIQIFRQQILDLLNEVESLKSENERHEREESLLSSYQGQLKVLKEKASKDDEERKNVFKRVDELENMNRSLREKDRDFTTLKKRLAETRDDLLSSERKYKEALQLMACIKAEKVDAEEQISAMLEVKNEAEATIEKLNSISDNLQEKLTMEERKSADLLQRCQDYESKNSELFEKMNTNLSQLKTREHDLMDLKTHEKEMETVIHKLQEENKIYRSQIDELEEKVSVLEENTVFLKSSKHALETMSAGLQKFNDELLEKLRNAQEDIEWGRENTNTLVNEIRELEGELESDSEVKHHLEQKISELEVQKVNLQAQVGKLSENIIELEKEVMDYKERYKDATNEIASLRVVVKQKQESIDQHLASDKENVEKIELEEKLIRSQERVNQLKRDLSDSDGKQMQTLSEVLILKAQKVALEEAVQKSEEILSQVKNEASVMKANLETKLHEAILKELDTRKCLEKCMKDAELLKEENMEYSRRILELEATSQEVSDQVKNEASIIKEDLEMKLHDAMLTVLKTRKHLEESVKEAELLKAENFEYSQRLIELNEKCSVSESEKKKLYTQMILEVSNKSGECERYRKEKEATEKSLACLKQEKDEVELSLASTVAELMGLKERLKSQEEVVLKEEAYLKEVNNLKNQISEHQHKLSEQKVENKDLKKRIYALEEELEHKRNSLILSEKKLRDKDANGSPVSLIARSLSRASSKVGPLSNFPPTREAIELADFQQKVKLLESEVKIKADELERSKQLLKEQHAELSLRIEHLEHANEQLTKESSHSKLDKILRELDSLRKQNAVLSQREIELLAKINAEESLEDELEKVKEDKKELESALSKFAAAASSDNIVKKVATLEMELAEVLEANNMYRKQLQSAFSEQQNVHVAALQSLGSVEGVLEDLADLKRQNTKLDDELQDMKDRYFNMSLRFAEVEAERGQLVMAVKALQSGKKLMPIRSANF